ncbi:MAG: hypothetical protein HY682_11410 [Chloroflexi bacterium]|nr:hypothetical protein [Chloroflexota bacterium]
MQGARFSARWALSFTVVGFIALFVALISIAWPGTVRDVGASPLNDADPVCTTGTKSTETDDVLSHIIVLPSSATLNSGDSQLFQAVACDGKNERLETGLTITWSATAGSIAGDGRFTAPTVGSQTSVTITGSATHTSTTTAKTANATVTVNPVTPAPTPTPIPPFTGATPVPPAKPATVVTQETIVPDKSTTVVSTDPASGQKLAEVVVPAGAVTTASFVQVGVAASTVATEAAGKLPGTLVTAGGKLVQINIVDSAGTPIRTALGVPVTIRIPYTDAEAAAVGGALNLRILKYDEVGKSWSPLATSVDLVKKELSAQVSTFSVFTSGGAAAAAAATPTPTAVPATPAATATPALPSTGGVAPGTGVLVGFLAAGLLLVILGALYVRFRPRPTS